MTLHVRVNEDVAVSPTSSVESFKSQTFYKSYAKRGLDIALVLLFLPIVGPLVLLMAAVTALNGSNPFYSQLRVGKNGRFFRIWKIRTMTVDAEARLESYLKSNPEARAEWNKHQKLKNDPRITTVGRFLRKASLDELPQLFNVLQGSMSLVGPRPMMPEQEQYYFGSAYYSLRPGLTGLWQISERNESSFVDRVAFDDAYSRSMSFGTDMKTLLKTVLVVIRGTGY
ncbi:Sugar transferase involved in LPS biosynthesis (colanic, teichoic acid) [Cognatiyoonia sediminum]|uniref:Sugar transferase involved in LPS biosynthesis (Colanic, teichoic acid) n=1 Tax=Cognatiyoonia sediminum TaxID=1508389 RepID=A0A1M5Q2R6_9RHOB|nr:sugar transferase [Cognatiyoonia sediminum]SHH07773.1 Sugar transferase involved in LPS biosynthesis (colanic, teichoic acid) [Cognatiyoonia sediminum]